MNLKWDYFRNTHEKIERNVKKIAPMMLEEAKLNMSSLLLQE